MARSVRILVVSDTHVGFDSPARVRSGRRVRGVDFLGGLERALAPALAGEVDVVVHAGDVFDVPEPPPAIAESAYALLRAAADVVPVFVLPGNHERSRLPCPLLAMHPNLHAFDRPRMFAIDVAGTAIAIGGFPYAARVRGAFARLVADTQLLHAPADIRLLIVHHCIEGAVVSLPDGGTYRFSTAADVIAARDIPTGIAALLSGHIHRHQVLTDLACPVIYGGSVERTAFAEASETKGFYILTLEPTATGGRVTDLDFRPLPTRPMLRAQIDPQGDVRGQVRRILASADPNAIVRLELAAAPQPIPELSAAALRAFAPATMNVHVVWGEQEPRFARLSRARARPRQPLGT
jgi:DNA repair exonuclease SbcCD nuclease subunit